MIQVGDRVTRKSKALILLQPTLKGTVIEKKGERSYIRWDEKASNGQTHSTIQDKYLMKLEKGDNTQNKLDFGTPVDFTDYLVKNYGFKNIRHPLENLDSRAGDIDTHKVSAIKRVGDIHYMLYSATYGYFSVGVKFDEPKGQAGGGSKSWKIVMIPKFMATEQDVIDFLKGTLPGHDNLYA